MQDPETALTATTVAARAAMAPPMKAKVRRAVNAALFLAVLRLFALFSNPSLAAVIEIAFILAMATGVLALSRVCISLLLADVVATVAMGGSDLGIFSTLMAVVLLYYLANGAIAIFRFRAHREA